MQASKCHSLFLALGWDMARRTTADSHQMLRRLAIRVLCRTGAGRRRDAGRAGFSRLQATSPS